MRNGWKDCGAGLGKEMGGMVRKGKGRERMIGKTAREWKGMKRGRNGDIDEECLVRLLLDWEENWLLK